MHQLLQASFAFVCRAVSELQSNINPRYLFSLKVIYGRFKKAARGFKTKRKNVLTQRVPLAAFVVRPGTARHTRVCSDVELPTPKLESEQKDRWRQLNGLRY